MYNPKVQNPNANLIQSRSETINPPFFMGGSQVPYDLGLINPNTIEKSNYDKRILGYGFLNRKNKILETRK